MTHKGFTTSLITYYEPFIDLYKWILIVKCYPFFTGENSTGEKAYTSMPDNSMTTETPVNTPQPITTPLSTDAAVPPDG